MIAISLLKNYKILKGEPKLLENIEVLCHSSIKLNKGPIIYFDPFKINKNYHDADIIFITHDHYDHYSEEDIDRVEKNRYNDCSTRRFVSKIIKKRL